MHNLPPTQYKSRKDLPGNVEVILYRVTSTLGDANRAHHNLIDLESAEEILSAHYGGDIPAMWRSLIRGYTAAALAIANI